MNKFKEGQRQQSLPSPKFPIGLEAYKLGHGGDRRIADFLGIGVHTVARGRQELFSNQVQREGVRQKGGGRKAVEKKRHE